MTAGDYEGGGRSPSETVRRRLCFVIGSFIALRLSLLSQNVIHFPKACDPKTEPFFRSW